MPQDLTDEVNIGSGNGLVPSNNNPLPETKVGPRYLLPYAPLGHNWLI